MPDAYGDAQPLIPGYSYVRPLGSGGFAKVYLYEQDMPRRQVAIKVLDRVPTGASDADSLRAAFESEADLMARLSAHPSIVSIFQASISLQGTPYIAMEYCPDSMGARTKRKPAPLDVVLDAGVRVAGALETAHRANVLHRDIKPSNVLITSLGRPALSDFGISQVVGERVEEAQELAMSIPWSAPEVIQMRTPGTIASEVWALAATLYSFAAGRSPFELEDRAQNTRNKLSARIVKAVYQPVPGASGYEHFDSVLAYAMSKNPDERYASMLQFGEALQQLQRAYGYDVTPLDVGVSTWAPSAPTVGADGTGFNSDGTPAVAGPQAPRGPVVSSLGRKTRAEARAEMLAVHTDRDGLPLDAPRSSSLKPALIGAGAALAGVIVIGLIIWAATGAGQ